LLSEVLCWWFPKPDICYFLWNEPEEIALRKDDLDRARASVLLDFFETISMRFGAKRQKSDRPASELAWMILQENLPLILQKLYGNTGRQRA
jgi:hypothetical protein